MKTNMLIIIPLIAFLSAGALSLQSFSDDSQLEEKDKYHPLQEYLNSKSIDTRVVSLGGHQRECMTMEIKNLTTDTLFLFLEPGRRLVSEDSTHQDILIVKEKRVSLPPLAALNIFGHGFCCESNKSSPPKKAAYHIGFMAPGNWIKLAEFINRNEFPVSAVQHAVWVMSNNHPIGSIISEDDEDIMSLKEMVAYLKGCEIPWYTVKYEKDSTMLFSGRPEHLTGIIKYYLKNNAVVTITLRNDKGRLIKRFVNASPTGAGYHDYFIDLDVKTWPTGTYHVYVHEDNSNLNIKKSFVL